jgi:hypothetical protein
MSKDQIRPTILMIFLRREQTFPSAIQMDTHWEVEESGSYRMMWTEKKTNLEDLQTLERCKVGGKIAYYHLVAVPEHNNSVK